MPATIITPEDLQSFKKEFLEDIRKLLSEQKTVQERKWLKSGEVRKLFALSHGTLLQMRVNGLLPYTKIGGVIYYEYDDIKKMIDRHKLNVDSYQ